MTDITIIGAGIGGLTTAIALQQKGFKVSVFEQSEELKEVGAGIILANNAMQVYEKLGLREAIEKAGNPISTMNLTDADLQPLSHMDMSYFEKKYQVKNIAIHRGVLQRILLDQLTSMEGNLNHRLKGIQPTGSGYSLSFENGKTYKTAILIGADGLHSKVRQLLFPTHEIREAHQVCWRGITRCELPFEYFNELNEAWGKNGRFGFVQVSKNRVYWYALKSYKIDAQEFSVDQLENSFEDFNPIIKYLIKSTPKENIHTASLSDLKPMHQWFEQNACLIGDAAHATTPNMGQGACQAIEDAYVLSECMEKYATEEAFEKFQNVRLPKAHQVTNGSWLVGKVAHTSNPLLMGVRNLMMRWMPAAINRKQTEKIFQLPVMK